MKKAVCICLYAACLVFAPAAEAQILHIQEYPRTQRDTMDVPPGGLPIVDINSQLAIRPDTAAIHAAGLALFPEYFQKEILQSRIDRITKLLANQQRILDLTSQMVNDLNAQKDLLAEVEQYLMRLQTDTLLKADFNRYLEDYFEKFIDAPNPPDPILYSIERFNDQLETISAELKTIKNTSQIQFSIAAWRRDASGGARIHVENFDQFENGEFYSVPRWMTTLSENDRQQLDNIQQLAQGLNADASQVLDAYKAKILDAYPSITCLQTIPAELDLAVTSVKASVRTVANQFKAGVTGQILPAFFNLKNELANWPAGKIPDWEGRLMTTLNKVQATLDSLQATLGADSTLLTNEHLLNVNSCLQQAILDIHRVDSFITQFPYAYLNKLRLNTDTLSEKILAFKLNEIPPVGLIDLEYTGQRRPGDELLIKAVFRLPNDSTEFKSTGHPIESRRLKMVLIGAHSVTKIGVILANSYTLERPPDTPDFRFAPSAALLLKFGSRKSHFYNNFLDPGIGLNSAAPDFNLDGTPEFSVGIIGTIFRDILSVGWNWNFGLDKPNYFIGVHLPFNLPGVPVNTVESNSFSE